MSTRVVHSSALLLGCLGTIVILTSCSGEKLVEPPEQVAVCHVTGSSGAIIKIPRSELAAHLADGDYLTELSVSHDASQADDDEHFHRILDALDAVRSGRLARDETQTAVCRITITVASGVYQASDVDSSDTSVEWLPLVVDVPDITLHGALEMALDGNGRATEGTSSLATTILPTAPLLPPSEIIVANGHPGGSAGNGLTVEGFVFQSGWDPDEGSSGYAVLSMRVSGLTLRGNRWEHGFSFSMDLRATSAAITQNQIGGTGSCDICLAGPGTYQVIGNLLLAGANKGIIVGPVIDLGAPSVEPYDPPAESEVSADISNNEVRDHLSLPFGAAIRLVAVGIPPEVLGSGHFTVHDNLLVNNMFAMEIDALFPGPASTGDVDVTLGGNVMQQSCQADLLVSLTRQLPSPESLFLVNSTYTLDLGGDVDWDNVWYSHPDGFGNTLIVDGNTIANGERSFYDPDTCPGLAGS